MSKLTAYFANIYKAVATTLAGMAVTGKYAFKRPVTLRYPEVKHKIPERYRGILHNKIEDCIGCLACARACPVNCIHIKTSRRAPENVGKASDGTPIKLWLTQYDIDMSLCMLCGLCTIPCPTHCLTMSKQYEMAVYEKGGMYLRFATAHDREMAAKDAEALAKAKAAKAQKPAAGAGGTGQAKPAGEKPGGEGGKEA
jgi:NADH-quinone oxidoreductase subunit I